MKSLKRHLGVNLVVALLLVFGGQWLLVSFTIERLAENYISGRIEQDVDNLLAAISFDSDGQIILQNDSHQRYESGPYSGHYFVIQADQSRLVSESLWDQNLDVPPVPVGETTIANTTGPLDQFLLVVSKGFNKLGRNVNISVAEDISAVRKTIRSFQWQYLLLTGILLVILLTLQQWIIRRSLSPLEKTRLDLDGITRGNLSELNEDVPDEIRPLVREINSLLIQLSKRLGKTRNAIGNLAHSLKTPLSMINQVIQDPLFDDHPLLKRRMDKQVMEIRQSLERELGRARLAGDGKSGQRFSPAGDLPPLLETLKQLHAGKEIDFVTAGITGDTWPFEREDMLELFGNLLDNACKWAARKISIVLSRNDLATIIIDDDGSGCSPEKLDALSRRGLRLDETVEGHGLGLSIVRDIVSHYGGNLVFERSPELGGLRVSVILPVA